MGTRPLDQLRVLVEDDVHRFGERRNLAGVVLGEPCPRAFAHRAQVGRHRAQRAQAVADLDDDGNRHPGSHQSQRRHQQQVEPPHAVAHLAQVARDQQMDRSLGAGKLEIALDHQQRLAVGAA